MSLPSGIVTFVFTDIEGSTRLLRRLGDGYAAVLDRHRELLRAAWRAHDGIEVETEGDSVLVAFSDAAAAITGCVAAQRALLGEAWPADGVVRVRMGVHAGLAYPRGSAYVALAVHQTARVVSAAHGGQVLVSEHAAELAGVLRDMSLEPRGQFRLRDFDKPVRLYQASTADLPQEFGSIRALPAEGHNLVRPATSFIGREDAVSALSEMIAPGRLVSIIGPGGMGKTRLVTELGLRIASRWRDGVWFIDLAPLQNAGLIPAAMAAAVGCSVPREVEPWPAVLDYLRAREALLIFDNCEHVIERAAQLVAELRRACRGVGVLATSREALGVEGEQRWRLQPLANAGDSVTPAVHLFVARARATRADFDLDRKETAVVKAICDRLDNLPLGIELAAARVDVLSPAEILAGLDDRFRLLRLRDRAAPERHRTLDALLTWSYDLLSEEQKAALRRLGVFAGSFDLRAATAALTGGPLEAYDVPEHIWSLTERSLVAVEPTANGTRYRLLESIRAYALALLDASHETRVTANQIADWYLARLGPAVPGGSEVTGLRATEAENLRGLIGMQGEIGSARSYALAYSIARVHHVLGHAAAGVAEVRTFLAQIEDETPERVALLGELAVLLPPAGLAEQAHAVAAEAIELSRRVGGPAWYSKAAEQASALVAWSSGDPARALKITEEALAGAIDDFSLAGVLTQRAFAALLLNDFDTARSAALESLEVDRRLGRTETEALHTGNLAEIEYRSGNHLAAAKFQRLALTAASEAGLHLNLAFSMIMSARLLGHRMQWNAAVRLHSKAESILNELGRVLYESDREISDALLKRARGSLGDQQFQIERDEGERLSIPEAIELTDFVLREVLSDEKGIAGATGD